MTNQSINQLINRLIQRFITFCSIFWRLILRNGAQNGITIHTEVCFILHVGLFDLLNFVSVISISDIHEHALIV